MCLAVVHVFPHWKNDNIIVYCVYPFSKPDKQCEGEDLHCCSSWIRRSQSPRGWASTNRTMVREVPTPPSPSPAPFLLLTWLAHVERTHWRRSIAESIEKTPRKMPVGGSWSRSGGGKGKAREGGFGPGYDAAGSGG